MTKEKVIQTLIDDYSKQAKLSKREKNIFEHGLLTGIEIGPMEEPEVDLEEKLNEWRHNHFHGKRDDKGASGEYLTRVSQLEIARYFYELGLSVSNKMQKVE